jgi:glycosyltransferase involved in cell wall biosynthesis
MASGIPVICSNRSSLPEIGGDAVLTFDPEMHAEIARKIVLTLEDNEVRQQMITKGLERTRFFSWQRHADKLLENI